ncbi:MAG TPA: hypothetical protein VN112_12815, partial [Ensifer sp.]|nr:hypothetical protein [Ensifer sp.]
PAVRKCDDSATVFARSSASQLSPLQFVHFPPQSRSTLKDSKGRFRCDRRIGLILAGSAGGTMRKALLKDIMNQAAFLSLMPMGARWKNGKGFSGRAPGSDFRVLSKREAQIAGDERKCGTGDA